jgi:diguanylate cyclase (GGDEF)-like protein/PAS domain S-box-containing protein
MQRMMREARDFAADRSRTVGPELTMAANEKIPSSTAAGDDAPGPRVIGMRLLVVALLTGVATWLAIALVRPQGGVTIIWVASGLLAGILLTSPYRLWIAYIVAAFVGNLLARSLFGDAPAMVVSRGIASTLDACVVVYALRYWVGDVADPRNLLRVARVAIVSTIAGCALSALIAATATAALGYAPFIPTAAAWFASHTLGMVIFATVVGVIRELGAAVFGRRDRRWEFVRTMGLLAAVALWVFTQSRYPLLFLVYPPLVLAVFRHRFAGFAIGIALVVVISVVATSAGVGPLSLIGDASAQERSLLLQLFLAVTCVTTLPIAIMLAERGRLVAKLSESERNYRLLADNSHDLVVRMSAVGRRLYVSPSIKDLLGWEPADLTDARWDLVHPDDRQPLMDVMNRLLTTGEPASVVYRAQHKLGYYVLIEALARRVPSADPAGPAEIVYSGRDVSDRVQAERALAENQRRLRIITDNLPALVGHVDTGERFTFVNAQLCESLGRGPEAILGHTMPAVLGWRVYNEIRPHVQVALRGEHVAFEVEREFRGQHLNYQASYVPEIAQDGTVNGFLMLLFDISRLKRAERALELLARNDSLTGLANRLQFKERLALALARRRRDDHAVVLLCLDIDRFKQINDTYGHAAGDAVLCEFSARIRANVRETDLAARLGGDEFVVLVEDAHASEIAEVIAHKLLEAMRQPFGAYLGDLRATASIGIGIGSSGDDAESLTRRADAALYAAKAAGRDTCRTAAAE